MKPITGHRWLDYTATINRVTSYTTTTGGSQIPAATSSIVVMCCVQPHTSREMLAWARDTGKRVSLAIFDPLTSTGANTGVSKDDILTIVDPASNSRQYRALGPSRNSSGVSVQVECDLEEHS